MSHNHKVKVSDPGSHDQGIVIHKQEVMDEGDEPSAAITSNHHRSQNEPADDDEDDTPIHFVYDKDTMAAAASRDANAAWQVSLHFLLHLNCIKYLYLISLYSLIFQM